MKRKTTDFIAIHCAATTAKQNIGAREIDKWHRQRGFLRIGYHYVIRRDGTLEYGRELEEIGAHVLGYNDRSVGICLVGGSNADDINLAENNFTDKQWETLKALLRVLRKNYPVAVIQGHRDFADVKKACPSFDVKTWLKENLPDVLPLPAEAGAVRPPVR